MMIKADIAGYLLRMIFHIIGILFLQLMTTQSILALPLSGSFKLEPGLNLVHEPIAAGQRLTAAEWMEQLGGEQVIERVQTIQQATQSLETCRYDQFGILQGNACDLLLENGKGWMVTAKISKTVNYSVDIDCPFIEYEAGVNLLAFPCADQAETGKTLLQKTGGPDSVAAIQKFDLFTGRWSTVRYDESGNPVGSDFTIQPANAYLLHALGTLVAGPVDSDGDGLTDAFENLIGSNPNSQDSDSDGLNDGQEVAAGTNPTSADSDSDGISDSDEINIYGTDPLKADSDGDGISDGEEIAAGSNPLDDTDVPQPTENLTQISSSPSAGESGVAVTRETIIRFTRALAVGTVIDENVLFAEFGGKRLAARIQISTNRDVATLFYNTDLPPSARIRVTLVGDNLLDDQGKMVDVDGNAQPGGTAFIDFDTLALSSVAGTAVCGRVFASELIVGEAGGSTNVPLQGVTITVDGLEDTVKAVTDQFGNFRLENAPAGRFFVHIDGRSASNGVPEGGYYPFVGKKWESIAGEETNIGQIYLPLIQPGSLQSVSDTQDTTISFPQIVLDDFPDFAGVQLTVPAGALFADDGTIGGKVGIAPVPPDRLPGKLPPELTLPLVITVQTDGATNFNQRIPVCFPNLPDPTSGNIRNPGDSAALMSFNHDAGRFEVVGSMTVSADGKLICSDPGQGIIAPGWHGVSDVAALFKGSLKKVSDFLNFLKALLTSVEPGGNSTPSSTPTVASNNSDNSGETGSGSSGGNGSDGSGGDNGAGNDTKTPDSNQDSEPLYLFSGEFYDEQKDFRIKGRGLDFVWSRKYRSQIGVDTAQGNGWDFSYNVYLKASGQDLIVHDGNSRNDIYTLQSDGSWTRPEFFRRLIQNADNTFTLSFQDTGFWLFAPLDGSPAQGKLQRIEDRNGNALQLNYDGQGRLISIIDTLDRTVTISYNPQGFISDVTDFIGRTLSYQYYDGIEAGGSAGDLKSVTTPAVTGTSIGNNFPNGKTTSYTYSTGFADERLNHNLLTITDGRRNDPNDPTFDKGPYLVNVFAETTDPNNLNFDRVIRQIWGGDIIDLVYVPQIPANIRKTATLPPIPAGTPVLKTIVNDRNGNVAEYFWDKGNRRVMLREFTGRANPVQPTTELSNRPVKKLRDSDPDYFETRYEYNIDSLLTRKIFPNGNIMEYVYQSELDPSTDPRSRSNVRIKRYLPGSHQPAGDQAFIQSTYDYHPVFNFVTRHTDGRDNTSSYQYDNNGNLFHIQHRLPAIIEDFEYNAFGQMITHLWPDNGSNHRRRDKFNYYDTGIQRGYLAQAIIDAGGFNLTTAYQYDAVGNTTRVTDPRGHDTQYEFNQLDQVVRTISREVTDGSNIRYQRDFYYDANNNIVRRDIQNIDETGTVQTNTHFTEYLEYEILDYLTRDSREVDEANTIVYEYTYDNNRNRILQRSGEAVNGNQPTNTVNYAYDERDLLFQVIRAQGAAEQSTNQFDYDGNKNLKLYSNGLEDAAPRIHQVTFDGYDRSVTLRDPLGNVTNINYDANSNRLKVLKLGELLDVAGDTGNIRLFESALQYDAMDRMTQQENAFFDSATQNPVGDGLSISQYIYNDNSQVLRVTDDNGHQTQVAYDSANRREVVTDAKGNTITYGYDNNSNIASLTEIELSDLGQPNETFVTTRQYDNLDRLIKTVDNAGNIMEYRYDSRNNRTISSDALRPDNANDTGNSIRYVYDGLNRLLSTTHILTADGSGAGNVIASIVTRQIWDDSSRLIARIDDNGNMTSYSYDPLNRKSKTVYADATEHRYSYDVHDNVIQMTDANGSVTVTRFDLLDRPSSRTITPGAGVATDTTVESYQYDGLSRLVKGTDNDSSVLRAYDSLSNVIQETQNGQVVQSLFDGVGNRLQCIYPGGRRIDANYDELDRIQTISDGNGQLAAYDYIGPSRSERRRYANNTVTDWGYDAVKRITRTTHTLAPDTSATVFDDRAYVWDRMYNKTQRQNLLAGGLTHQYHYDSIYRLTQSVKALGANVPSVIDYTLDGVGNRTQVVGGSQAGIYTLDNTLPNPADHQTNQYTSTAFDQRQYDLNGNLTTFDRGLASERNLSYDYRNQMVSFNDNASGVAASYAYDVFGRRIGKTVNGNTTLYFYDGWRVIEEQDQSNIAQATYVYGRYIDEVLNMQRGGQDYFYHGDDLYNVMKVTGSNGTVSEQYEFGDYGAPELRNAAGMVVTQSAIGNPYLFNGRRYDPETGFYYYRTRYLDPKAGRFTTRDTIGIWGDFVNLGNGVAYVGGNPWTLVDPRGLNSKRMSAESKDDSECDIYCEIKGYKEKDLEKKRKEAEEYQKWFDEHAINEKDFKRQQEFSKKQKMKRFYQKIDDFGKGVSDAVGATEFYYGTTYAESGEINNYEAYKYGVYSGVLYTAADLVKGTVKAGFKGIKNVGKFISDVAGGKHADKVAVDLAGYVGDQVSENENSPKTGVATRIILEGILK